MLDSGPDTDISCLISVTDSIVGSGSLTCKRGHACVTRAADSLPRGLLSVQRNCRDSIFPLIRSSRAAHVSRIRKNRLEELSLGNGMSDKIRDKEIFQQLTRVALFVCYRTTLFVRLSKMRKHTKYVQYTKLCDKIRNKEISQQLLAK